MNKIIEIIKNNIADVEIRYARTEPCYGDETILYHMNYGNTDNLNIGFTFKYDKTIIKGRCGDYVTVVKSLFKRNRIPWTESNKKFFDELRKILVEELEKRIRVKLGSKSEAEREKLKIIDSTVSM